MISHLGSVILICGIALTVAAPYYRHEPEEQYRRNGEPQKEPGKIFCFWGPRHEEPVREPEEHYRIPEEHYRIPEEPEEHYRILEEPEGHYRRQEVPVQAYQHGDIQDNYFEEPFRDTGYDTGYLEPFRDTGYLEPFRDTGYDTGYLDDYFEEPPLDTEYIVEEEYGPPYLVASYPQVYDSLYDYDYDYDYDNDNIGSYDSLDLEGLFLDGFFGSRSSMYDSGLFRYLRGNPEYFGYDSSFSSSSSSSSEPDKHFKFEFPFDAFFKHETDLAGSQALDSSFERDFVSPVVNPPPFYKEISPESPSSEEDSYDFPYLVDNDSQRSDGSSECSDSDDAVTGSDSEFGIDSDDSSLDSTFFDFLNRNPDYFDFD